MLLSWFGPRGRIFLLQLLVVAAVVTGFRLYFRHQREETERQAPAVREKKIEAMFQAWVIEDPTRDVSVSIDAKIVQRHPQKLSAILSPAEVEAALGVPSASTTDFRGGQHLTWTGTTHELKASFNAGCLYCLDLKDRTTGHGAWVYDSYALWRPY